MEADVCIVGCPVLVKHTCALYYIKSGGMSEWLKELDC